MPKMANIPPLEAGEPPDKATCGICYRQVSRYTCPSCNVPYCSLTCFRSNEHAQCSEVFYKHELESEIRTRSSASLEERKRMLEMLKKFEEEEGNEDTLEGAEEDDDGDDLMKRIGNIDINQASMTEIWDALTIEERDSFLSKIRDPSSTSAQELLRSVGVDLDIVLPWWEAPEVVEDEPFPPTSSNKKYGKRPSIEEIPEALLHRQASPDAGPPLLYNICSVFIAYAYVTRHLGVSPLSSATEEEDRTSARDLIQKLVPFLFDKHSTTLFRTMDDVVTNLWPQLVDERREDRASFVAILRDAARLFTPRRVAVIEGRSSSSSPDNIDIEASPQRDVLAALSDLIALFKSRGGKTKETAASLKLRFYAAQIASLPAQLLAAFSSEIGSRARSMELEGESSVQHSLEVSLDTSSVVHRKADRKTNIEEV